MNTGDSPPGNGKGGQQAARPENSNHKLKHYVTAKKRFCKRRLVEVRRALAREQWLQLRHLAELPGIERFSRAVSDWRAS